MAMTREQLMAWAVEHNVSFEKAESLARQIFYREEYQQRDYVVARRREHNRVNWQLTKSLRRELKSE